MRVFTLRQAAPVSEAVSDILVQICVTCRKADDGDDARPGADLFAALQAKNLDCTLQAVECLGVCKRPCTLAMSCKGKWTYIYGDLPKETGADIIAAALPLYQAAANGIIAWKERPTELKKGMVARLPPI